MNTIGYFEIQSSSPAKLAEFYKNIFGWNFVKDPMIPIEYYRMTDTEGIMGAILQRPVPVPAKPAGTNAYVCSVQVSSFDNTSTKILGNGGIVAMDKFAIPGKCWQGYFLDTDGNTFGVYQPDGTAK